MGQKELETAEYQDSEGMLERKQATGEALPYKMCFKRTCTKTGPKQTRIQHMLDKDQP